jgi:hypothetical protein
MLLGFAPDRSAYVLIAITAILSVFHLSAIRVPDYTPAVLSAVASGLEDLAIVQPQAGDAHDLTVAHYSGPVVTAVRFVPAQRAECLQIGRIVYV